VSEEWRAIPGYPNYLVSDLGNIRSMPRQGSRGGVLALFPNKYGYPFVSLHSDGVQKSRAVHQLVLAAFLGPMPEGMEIRHLDGNPANNRLGNLAYGTHAENNRDIVDHGRNANKNKTHCHRGHEFDEENLYRNPAGSRVCRECRRLAARERELRNPGAKGRKQAEYREKNRAILARKSREYRKRVKL
jgi:HNH endonuclease/NUMOD4 motif